MSKFLKTATTGATLMVAAWILVGCQPKPDEALNAKVAALDTAVAELRAEMQANQEAIIKQFKGIKGGQQTMIRRGVVIVPPGTEKPTLIGDKTSIEIGSAPTLGDPDAPVEVVEFGEFQCPYCMKYAGALRALTEAYPGKVRTAFKHYPLNKHEMALHAGKASWAAQQQGKFWEMHDALFGARGQLDPTIIRAHAQAIGLDMQQFDDDLASPEATRAVFADRRAGKKAGVKGTPVFFVNGRLVGGNLQNVKKMIDAELANPPAAAPAKG